MMTGWQTKPLGQLATFKGGGTPSKSQPSFWDGDVPWVSPKDMKFDQISTSRDSISMEAVAHSSANLIPTASILVVVRSGILARTIPVSLTTRELTVNQDIKAICPKASLDPKYLHYFMRSAEKALLKKVTRGATVHRLSTDDLKNLLVPLPPFPEQKRIVTILDEAFEGIDAAIANTQANLDAARELFESFLEHKLINQENDWEELDLGEVAEFRNGLNFTRTSKGEAIKIVGVKDFQREFYVPSDTLETVTVNGKLRDIDCLKDGDILAVRSNGNKALIGRCLLARGITDTTSHSGFTIRIRLASKDILPEFLTYFMKSSTCHKMLVASGGGANISNLNQKALSSLAVRFPPIFEQKKIISEFEELEARSRDLTSKYQQKLDALYELKQSILAKAFRGELTQEEIAA